MDKAIKMQSENETRGAQRIAAFRAAPQRETLCPQIYALVKKKPRTYTHTGVCVRVTRDFFSAIKWCAAYISLLYFYRFFLHICARRARSSESAEMRMMKKKKKNVAIPRAEHIVQFKRLCKKYHIPSCNE